MNNENNPVISQQERYFLNTFPLIKKLIRSKSEILPPRVVEDLLQQVKYKLWKWKENYLQNRELSFEEWQKLANTTTRHETIDYLRRKENQNLLFSEIAFEESFFLRPQFRQASAEGETGYEARTLLRLIWQRYLQLSLRQRYAFLLLKEDFVTFLLKYGCCTAGEIADSLGLEENEFIELLAKLPLSETEVSELLAEKQGENLTVGQVRTARSKAKANLLKSIRG